MSNQIDTAFVKQYHAVVERLLQQQGTKFRAAVRVESQASEEQFWDQIGVVEAQEDYTRFGDSPVMNTPHARRRVTLRQFDVGDYFDSWDKIRTLIDPTSTYIQNFVDALNRALDIVIIGRQAINDDTNVLSGFFGTSYTGKAGGTAVTFPAGNQIAVNFGGANSNLTINKLIEADRLLRTKFNEKGREPWYISITASQLASMLKTTQVTSADYNTVKALVKGEINSFMGFDFIHSEYLLKNGSGFRRVPIWVKSGMLLSVGMEIKTEVAKRADKKFNWYAYAAASFGSTRMQEDKVLECICDEAA